MSGKNLKSVKHYKYLGAVLNTEHSDEKTFRDNCDKNIVQQKSYEPSRCSNAVENYFFIPFVRPCMHHKYGGISESHACKDCVWPIILDAELYTTCPGDRNVSSHDSSLGQVFATFFYSFQ